MACVGYKGCELSGWGQAPPVHFSSVSAQQMFYATEVVAVVVVVAYIRTVTVRVTIWSVK